MKCVTNINLPKNLDEIQNELSQDNTLKLLVERINSFFSNLESKSASFSIELIKFHHHMSLFSLLYLKKLFAPYNSLIIGSIYNIMQLQNIPEYIKIKFLNELSQEIEKNIIDEINNLYLLEIQIPWRLNKDFNNKYVNNVLNKVRMRASFDRISINSKLTKKQQLENHRKLFLASAKSIEILIIKLVDRLTILKNLHNYKKLDQELNIDEKFRQSMASETLNIHANLADHFGIGCLKWYLEDYAFRLLDSYKYEEIRRFINKSCSQREDDINTISAIISKKLQKQGINAKIEGRPKNIYSIYKKIENRNFNKEQINDLLGIRIIVSGDKEKINISNCYKILKMLLSLWKPDPGIYNGKKYLDWIKKQKPNKYRSIHTTLLCNKNGILKKDKRLEVQIRTQKMHESTIYGAIPHWVYKENVNSNSTSDQNTKNFWTTITKSFFERKSEEQNEFVNYEFGSFFDKSCFTISPEGEIFELKKDIFKLTQHSLDKIKGEISPNEILEKLKGLKNHVYMNDNVFIKVLEEKIGKKETNKYKSIILKHCLKKDATVLDYAYKVHTELGKELEKQKDNVTTKVNNKYFPVDHVLQNGDIVEISKY